jgi:hypothetical protein
MRLLLRISDDTNTMHSSERGWLTFDFLFSLCLLVLVYILRDVIAAIVAFDRLYALYGSKIDSACGF